MYSAAASNVFSPRYYAPYDGEPSTSPAASTSSSVAAAAACEKPENAEKNAIAPDQLGTARVLGRRYALTGTGSKYLEIGISVGPSSYVEIAIGDNRGHELTMSLETWKGLFELRWTILNFMRNESNDAYSFVSVGPLTVRVCTFKGAKVARLQYAQVFMAMTESTLRRLFDFDGCVDATFERLARLVDAVDVKFARFSNIVATLNPEDRAAAVRTSDAFDKRQLVDCELVALLF